MGNLCHRRETKQDDATVILSRRRDTEQEMAYHRAVRKAELEYGLSALVPPCTVNVQGFLLDPKYEEIIFVLPTRDVSHLRRSPLTLHEQLDSVKLPRSCQGYRTSFVSLQEYDNPNLLQIRQETK